MIEKRIKLKFSGDSMYDSVSYILVSKFDIVPNVLQAKIDGSGGRMILLIKGSVKKIEDAEEYLRSSGITVEPADDSVRKDDGICMDCGSCVSICPASAFETDRETWDVIFDSDKCVACGSCITACPVHALTMKLNL